MDKFIAALGIGIISAFVTAYAASLSVVSSSTTIGVVLPAALMGVAAFCIALWRLHRGESSSDIWRSIKELWGETW